MTESDGGCRVCVDCGVCEDRSGSGRSVDHGECREINKINKRAGFESSLIHCCLYTERFGEGGFLNTSSYFISC